MINFLKILVLITIYFSNFKIRKLTTMKPLFPQAPLCEYYIMISPSDEIKNEVKAMKLDFLKEHGTFAGQNSDAHITADVIFSI